MQTQTDLDSAALRSLTRTKYKLNNSRRGSQGSQGSQAVIETSSTNNSSGYYLYSEHSAVVVVPTREFITNSKFKIASIGVTSPGERTE